MFIKQNILYHIVNTLTVKYEIVELQLKDYS